MDVAGMGGCLSFGASPLLAVDHCLVVSALEGDETMDQTAMARIGGQSKSNDQVFTLYKRTGAARMHGVSGVDSARCDAVTANVNQVYRVSW